MMMMMTMIMMMMTMILMLMMVIMMAFPVELLGLLRWKAEPDKVLHCIHNLLFLEGLEIMKVCYFIVHFSKIY